MSSILKALQKLESETRKEDAGQSWLKNFTAGQRYPEKKERIRSKNLMALLCVGLIISVSAALVFIKREPPSTTSLSGSQPVQGVDSKTINSERSRADHFADKAIGVVETGSPEVESGGSPGIGTLNEDDEPMRAAVLPDVDKDGARKANPADIPADTGDTKKSGNIYPAPPPEQKTKIVKKIPSAGDKKTAPFSEPLETPENSSQPDATASPDTALNSDPDSIFAQKIHNPDMKLHAISWTPDAGTRIAVINGSIIREGDMIGRYLVYRINKDDVVFRESGEFWRLGFGSQ